MRGNGKLIVVDPAAFRGDEDMSAHGIDADVHCDLTDALAAADIDPHEVTLVLVTHGHSDHFNGVMQGDEIRFPNATHVFPAADWHSEARELLRPIEERGLIRLVDGDAEIDDDIAYLAAPGETAGHHVTRIGPFWYLGDLFHFVTEVERTELMLEHVAEPLLMGPARKRILEKAEGQPAMLSHGVFPGWGVIERNAEAFRFRYDNGT
jgi:glyoxylase-like metal-dependent hydrolase (beta-lactamase superfamily II)